MAKNRDFRHAISVLKKQGLLPAKADNRKKLDARSALPNWKVNGKRLDTLVRKYDDVVSEKISAVKVQPAELKQFRKQGFETAAGRVLVPVTKQEVAKFKGHEIRIQSKAGMERVMVPVKFENLKQYVKELRKNSALINKQKRANEYFGIRFKGGQKALFYSNIQGLLDALEHYNLNRMTNDDIYQNLEIMRISTSGAAKLERELSTRRKKMSKDYNRKHAKKQYRKTKQNPARLERRRALNRDNERQRRANMSPAEKAKYNAKARARYRRNKKKKSTKRKRK